MGDWAMSYIRFLVGLGCTLTVGIFFLSVEMPGTSAWSATNSAPQNVDRAMKGDRLPLIPALKPADVGRIGINDQSRPAVVAELLDGCESMVSTIGSPPLAKVAGRCLS
jgi:hypothetical protein